MFYSEFNLHFYICSNYGFDFFFIIFFKWDYNVLYNWVVYLTDSYDILICNSDKGQH